MRPRGATVTTPTELATKVKVADANDVRVAVEATLAHAGIILEELKHQAAEGRFTSEQTRLA